MKTINKAVIGPLVLDKSWGNLLNITSAGSVASTGGADGIDGAAARDWGIFNNGAISSTGGIGISLAGDGALTNAGTVSGLEGFTTGR